MYELNNVLLTKSSLFYIWYSVGYLIKYLSEIGYWRNIKKKSFTHLFFINYLQTKIFYLYRISCRTNGFAEHLVSGYSQYPDIQRPDILQIWYPVNPCFKRTQEGTNSLNPDIWLIRSINLKPSILVWILIFFR